MELTLGQVAARRGASVSTIHFYERKGLMQNSRATGNQRRYLRAVLGVIRLMQWSRRCAVSRQWAASIVRIGRWDLVGELRADSLASFDRVLAKISRMPGGR